MTVTSAGLVGVLTTATPRLPSADTDSIRPDQSPAAVSGAIEPFDTLTRYAAPRARTCAPKTIDCPSADHAYCAMPPLKAPVSVRGTPPSLGITQSFSSASSQDVSLGARYESSLPSGDHWTFCSGALLCVSVAISPVDALTTPISALFW